MSEEPPPGLLRAHQPTVRPCKYCTFFDGWAPVLIAGKQADGHSANCNFEGGTWVLAHPKTGCVHWKREVGTDDDLGEG
jgi:hypothetical protein